MQAHPRILALADAYEAITSDRPYRRAKGKEEALEELKKGAGAQFDPRLVEVFVERLAGLAEDGGSQKGSSVKDLLRLS